MREIRLSITIKASPGISDDDVVRAAQGLIEAGIEGAMPASGDADASGLEFGEFSLASTPRVLGFVSGGIADAIYDDPVDVVIFDCDEYKDAGYPDDMRLPARFADLAKLINAPCETDDSEDSESPR